MLQPRRFGPTKRQIPIGIMGNSDCDHYFAFPKTFGTAKPTDTALPGTSNSFEATKLYSPCELFAAKNFAVPEMVMLYSKFCFFGTSNSFEATKLHSPCKLFAAKNFAVPVVIVLFIFSHLKL